MSRRTLIIVLALCIAVAVFAIGNFVLIRNEDESSTEEPTVETTAVNSPTGAEKTEPQEPTDADDTTQMTTQTTTNPEATTSAASDATTAKAPETTEKKTESANEYEYAYAGFNPSVAVINSEKWNLLLVNQDYILPDSYTVKTANIAGGSGQKLDYRVVPYYDKMVAAAAADGISLIPVSGYRSLDRQRSNFERKINYYTGLGHNKAEATRLASKIVLMPGTSEHNAGLAMDFGTNGNYNLDENFAKTEAFKWLSAHAADYGFILRYDSDTTDITKITYEPWHWRYVGVQAAKEIKASGVTLEEYLGMA